jgi:hypothetical protein
VLELIQEIVVYSLVIICVLGLSVWWEQTWDPGKTFDWDKKNIISNVGIIVIIVTGLMIAKAYGS